MLECLNGVLGWQARSLTWEERVAVSAMAQIRITQTSMKLQDVSHTAPYTQDQSMNRQNKNRNPCAAMLTQEYIFHKAEQRKEAQTGPICQR